MVIENIKLRNVGDLGIYKFHCLKKNLNASSPS